MATVEATKQREEWHVRHWTWMECKREGDRQVLSPYYIEHATPLEACHPPQLVWGGYIP